MILRPPRSTRTDTLVPYTTLFRSLGEGALAWLSGDTMARLSAWLLASGLSEGPVFRRINVLTSPPDPAGQRVVRHYIGAKSLTRQGVVAILRRRVLEAIRSDARRGGNDLGSTCRSRVWPDNYKNKTNTKKI